MKKTNYKKAIIIGFLVMYVISMLISTNILAASYSVRYVDDWNDMVESFKQYLHAADESSDEVNNNLITYLLSIVVSQHTEFAYNQFSAAVYNKNTGEKVAQSNVLISDGIDYRYAMDRENCKAYAVSQYMTREELEHLANIELETREAKEAGDYPVYYYNFYVNKETKEPMAIEVLRLNWDNESDGGNFNQINSKLAYDAFDLEWRWYNPDVELELYEMPNIGDINVVEKVFRPTEEYEELMELGYSSQFNVHNLGIVIPYLNQGYACWQRWQADNHLQNYPDILMDEKGAVKERSVFSAYKTEGRFEYGQDLVLVVRRSSNAWLEAMTYMKYIYIVGFILMVVCMFKVLYVTEKTYKQQKKLEDTRRDFTNVVAHELKTPLGIIRAFAENLKENINEDKREYYLDQIVRQTENMDDLVKEMIYISKLDSEKLVLNKTNVSLRKLFEESLKSLAVSIDEKELSISYKGLSDQLVEGDSQYLKKAIWNILSNAVEYNHFKGEIEIIFEENVCKIRNTGKQIPEEELSQVFDLFYTGNKSRTKGEKHLGLGLYLTKKIFDLHGLSIEIGNTKEGVEITIFNLNLRSCRE